MRKTAKVNQIRELYKKLSKNEQVEVIKELKLIHKSSKKNQEISGEKFILRMKEEISDAIKSSPPRDVNNSMLNLIIVEATHATVRVKDLVELEKIAYRGLVEFANAYGYLSDQDEDFAVDHLEKFIELVKEELSLRQEEIFYQEKVWLSKIYSDNFYSEPILECFEFHTGLEV